MNLLETELEFYCKSYIYPWEQISLSDRLGLISSTKKINVVYIYDFPDNSTFRYRVFNVFQLMEGHPEYNVSYFFKNEIRYLADYIRNISLIIMSRTRWSFEIDNIISLAKKNGIPLSYDVDDFIFDVSKVPFVINTLGCNGTEDDFSFWFSYISRLFLSASKCDFFIGTNLYLKDKLEKFFQRDGLIIPNFLNKDQLNVSLNLNKVKDKNNNSDFKIGYFSGSPSHNNDFKVISKEIEELLVLEKDIKLIIVGYLELPCYLKKLIDNGKIIIYPFQNYINLQRLISSVDINLIPLRINEFTHCKSELKFFEAGIVKTISVASPTYVYKKAIVNWENGFVANQGEWLNTIIQIKNFPEKVNIAQNAYQCSIENYSGEKIKKTIAPVFEAIINKGIV